MNKMENDFRYRSISTGVPLTLEERATGSGYPSSFVMAGTSAYEYNTFLMNYLNKKIENIPVTEFEINPIDPQQKWYWTTPWQKAEREADEAYVSGDVETFDNMDEFVNTL